MRAEGDLLWVGPVEMWPYPGETQCEVRYRKHENLDCIGLVTAKQNAIAHPQRGGHPPPRAERVMMSDVRILSACVRALTAEGPKEEPTIVRGEVTAHFESEELYNSLVSASEDLAPIDKVRCALDQSGLISEVMARDASEALEEMVDEHRKRVQDLRGSLRDEINYWNAPHKNATREAHETQCAQFFGHVECVAPDGTSASVNSAGNTDALDVFLSQVKRVVDNHDQLHPGEASLVEIADARASGLAKLTDKERQALGLGS